MVQITAVASRCLQCFIQKLFVIFGIQPSRSDFYVNISGFQRFRHGVFQSIDIDIKIRIIGSCFFSNHQLLTNITGKIFRSCLICIFSMRNFVNFADQIFLEFCFRHTGQLAHVIKIDTGCFCNRQSQCFQGSFNVFDGFWRLNGSLCENI